MLLVRQKLSIANISKWVIIYIQYFSSKRVAQLSIKEKQNYF